MYACSSVVIRAYFCGWGIWTTGFLQKNVVWCWWECIWETCEW